MMKLLRLMGCGLVGSCTMTLLHESARRFVPHAPRLDVLGERAIAQSLRVAGQAPPAQPRLHRWALAGDLASNAAYFGLAGLGDKQGIWKRSIILGLLAGLGAVFLPAPLGLGQQPGRRSPFTDVLTVLWYLIGSLSTAAALHITDSSSH